MLSTLSQPKSFRVAAEESPIYFGHDVSIALGRDPRIRIHGEEAVHVGAIFTLNDNKYRTEQYAVSHGDNCYVVTVSLSPDVPAAERDALGESILTTWTWES
jgi:hypothetical protein